MKKNSTRTALKSGKDVLKQTYISFSVRATVVLTIFFYMGTNALEAQNFERGDIMFGTDLGSGLVNSQTDGLFGLNVGLNDGAGFNVGISPKLGFFLNENFLVGAAINLGFSKSSEDDEGESIETFGYGLQGFVRYYITANDVGADGLSPRSIFFFENNLGMSGLSINDGPSTIGFAFGFGPGLAYFITENVALEATLKYNGLLGKRTDDFQNSIGLNIGFQIVLDRAKTENIIERIEE